MRYHFLFTAFLLSACDPFTAGTSSPTNNDDAAAASDAGGGLDGSASVDSGDAGVTGPLPVIIVAGNQSDVTSLLATETFLYWTDATTKQIKRVPVDAPDANAGQPEVFATSATPPHALFYRGQGKVAWAEADGIYERLESSPVVTTFLQTTEGVVDFTITPADNGTSTRTWWISESSQKVFSVLGNNPKIEKDSLRSPFAIASASTSNNERVYWTNGNGQIRTSDSDTTDVVSESENGCESIAITNDFIYWTRPTSGTIRHTPANDTGDSNDFVVAEDRPFSLTAYEPTGDVYWLTMNGTLRMASEATVGAALTKASNLRQETPFSRVSPHARNIAITDQYIYFVSWLDRTILRTKRN